MEDTAEASESPAVWPDTRTGVPGSPKMSKNTFGMSPWIFDHPSPTVQANGPPGVTTGAGNPTGTGTHVSGTPSGNTAGPSDTVERATIRDRLSTTSSNTGSPPGWLKFPRFWIFYSPSPFFSACSTMEGAVYFSHSEGSSIFQPDPRRIANERTRVGQAVVVSRSPKGSHLAVSFCTGPVASKLIGR